MLAAALAAAAGIAAGPAVGQATTPPECVAPKVARGDACVAKAQVARDLTAIVRRTMRAQKQKAVIYSVRVDGRGVVTAAEGESMTGVPATPAMHWRIGSIGFALLGTLALGLQEDGVVDLDVPIARWRPELPNADRVTLRMLLNGTAGYQDYVSDPLFLKALAAAPFRQFTDEELLAYAFRRRPECAPGRCWNYSHANFVIAQEVLAQATGTPFATLMERRVLRPAGLRHTRSSTTPQIPSPILQLVAHPEPLVLRLRRGDGPPAEQGHSIAVTSTQLPGADADANVANTVLERVAAYLALETPPG